MHAGAKVRAGMQRYASVDLFSSGGACFQAKAAELYLRELEEEALGASGDAEQQEKGDAMAPSTSGEGNCIHVGCVGNAQ